MRKENKERILTICPTEVPALSSSPRYKRAECREKIFYTQFVTLLWAGFTFLLSHLSFLNTDWRVQGSLEDTWVCIHVLPWDEGPPEGRAKSHMNLRTEPVLHRHQARALIVQQFLFREYYRKDLQYPILSICFLTWQIKALNQVTSKVFSGSNSLWATMQPGLSDFQISLHPYGGWVRKLRWQLMPPNDFTLNPTTLLERFRNIHPQKKL